MTDIADASIIKHYFPDISTDTFQKMESLYELYSFWNERINVISRKDFPNFYAHHVLHSLSIAKIFSFPSGIKILDVGTGGGFPGIPLAIFFQDAEFLLVDSIGKKIQVVKDIIQNLGISNCRAEQVRAEGLKNSIFDCIISRAVAPANTIISWTERLLSKNTHIFPHGFIFLKGGDVERELERTSYSKKIYAISDFFDEMYFSDKKIIYLSKK